MVLELHIFYNCGSIKLVIKLVIKLHAKSLCIFYEFKNLQLNDRCSFSYKIHKKNNLFKTKNK